MILRLEVEVSISVAICDPFSSVCDSPMWIVPLKYKVNKKNKMLQEKFIL